MKYTVVTKIDDKSQACKEKIMNALNDRNWIYDEMKPELVICIGGDGTLLYGVHQYLDILDEVNFVGVHTGTLGFFTDYTEDEVDTFINDITTKEPSFFYSRLLKVELIPTMDTYYALNEMRVENVVKSQIMDVYVDEEYFETCRGSGACLSTQAGSTAYNRSLKGAVVDSGLSLMQFTQITPIQHNKHRSLDSSYILKEDRIITMKSTTFDTAILCYDHLSTSLENTNKIRCMMSDKKVRFARYREYSYLKRLKNLY